MKQFIFMLSLTLLGGVGTLYHPFWGLLVYYLFAVLRPQWLWQWALPIEMRWSLIAAITVLIGVGLNMNKLVFKRRYTAAMWLILAYGVCLLGSILTAKFPGIAMSWGIEYAKILLIALVSGLVISRLWQIELVTVMILVALGYLAWHINSLYLFEGRLDVYHIGFGGLDNNGAGLMIAMGAPFAYAYAVTCERRWLKALAVIAGMLILHATMMTYSRGAMVASCAGLVWLLLHHRQRLQAAMITVALVIAVSIMAGHEIRERFYSVGDYAEDGSAQLRFASWTAGAKMALDHPLTGVGIRNSHKLIHNYGDSNVQNRTIHSQFIQIAADSGLIAAAIYITLLAVSLLGFRRCRRLIDRFFDEQEYDLPPPRKARLTKIRTLAMAGESSLITFTMGSLFLSMEMFELSWLLVVLGGAMPNALVRYLDSITESGEAPVHDPDPVHRLLPPLDTGPEPEDELASDTPAVRTPAGPWRGAPKGLVH